MHTKRNAMGMKTRTLIGFAGLGLFTMGLIGCVSYTNVPVPESAPAFQSANNRQSIEVLARALEAVIWDHPVNGEYAINFPVGTTPETAQKIVSQLPIGAIVPFEGMSDDTPVYSIGRVWIRLSDAKVDVVYPFMRADRVSQDQSVTVWLNGGIRRWRMNRLQHWSAGTVPTPPVYVPIWPEPQLEEELEKQPLIDTVDEPALQKDIDESSSVVQEEYMSGVDEAKHDADAVEPAPIEKSISGDGYYEVPVKSGE